MSNPYEVLGLKYGASEQELRNAYKKCARMYANDPYMMGQIDRAYDEILSHTQGTYSDYGFNGSNVRSMINSGNIREAQNILNNVAEQDKNAEWFFIQGLLYQKTGRLNDAFDCFSTAVNYEPDNFEYQNALNAMNQSRNGGYRTNSDSQKEKDGCCNICSVLICEDCCCECMGCDLIPCC